MSWQLLDRTLASRLMIGSAQYPSVEMMQKAVKASGAGVVTLSLRRQDPGQKGGEQFWEAIQSLSLPLLPNTAGCHTAREALNLARMSRELLGTDWIKLEVIGDEYNLQPDPLALIEASRQLTREGFKVLPYCTEDLVLCRRLLDAGCEVLMPWAAPIGTGKGLINPYGLRILRERLPDVPIIIDAGLGRPSQACQVMEMGFDGVLLNSAIAKAEDPVAMAEAFGRGVTAGHQAYLAGAMPENDIASPSTPTLGTPFWRQEEN